LFHFKQFGSIQAYIDSFSELVDQLVAYEHSVEDQHYFIARFVDGLKDEIKSVVLVQRPINLDSAYTLALLQEEAESGCRKELRKPEFMYKPKPLPRTVPLPLPSPPKADKAAGTSVLPDRRVEANQVDGKVVALRAYHRARRLCQYYAEKWSRGHKCAPTVQLQAVQELWDLLQLDQESEVVSEDAEQEVQLNLILSREAVSAGGTSKTLEFLVEIQGNPVIILVDSVVLTRSSMTSGLCC
jgi:hypothetical protein